MKITRRNFLKISGASAAGTLMGGLGFDLSPVESYAQELRIKGAKETTTVCCYCSVGCGIIVHTDAKGTKTHTFQKDAQLKQGADGKFYFDYGPFVDYRLFAVGAFVVGIIVCGIRVTRHVVNRYRLRLEAAARHSVPTH